MNENPIASAPVFAALPPNEIQYLSGVLRKTSFPAGSIHFREGDPGDRFSVITAGQVEIVKAVDSPDERLLSLLNPGEFIGEMSLFYGGRKRSASARALTPVPLLELTRFVFLNQSKRSPPMSQPCEVKNQPAEPTLCIRATTRVEDIPRLFDHAYKAIIAHLASQGRQAAGPPYAAYFNMDMQNLQMEVGFPVANTLPGAGEIAAGEIPAGAYAVTLHKGPYQNLSETYQALGEWVAANGYKATGASYEFYLTDPTTVAPQHLLTELRFPLAS